MQCRGLGLPPRRLAKYAVICGMPLSFFFAAVADASPFGRASLAGHAKEPTQARAVWAFEDFYQGSETGLSADALRDRPLTLASAQNQENVPKFDGAWIREIQSLLKKLGYAGVSVDGKFGKTTYTAVQQFQTKSKLPADGMPTPQVMRALRAASASIPSAPQTAERPPPAAAPAPPSAPQMGRQPPPPPVAQGRQPAGGRVGRGGTRYDNPASRRRTGLPGASAPPAPLGREVTGCGTTWHNARMTGPGMSVSPFRDARSLSGKRYLLQPLNNKKIVGGPVSYTVSGDRLLEESAEGKREFKYQKHDTLGSCFAGKGNGPRPWCLSGGWSLNFGLVLVESARPGSCELSVLGILRETTSTELAAIAKKDERDKVPGRFDFSRYNLSTDFDRINMGRFYLLKNPGYHNPDRAAAAGLRARLDLIYTIYHNGFSEMCKSEMQEPTTRRKSTIYTRTVIGGIPGPWDKGATYDYTIRNRFLASYERAQAGAKSFLTVIFRGRSLANDFHDIGRDVHRLLSSQGCFSSVVKQFEENLDRAFNDQPPLQDERKGFARMPIFAHSCKKPEILQGRLKDPARCGCVYDNIKKRFHPTRFEDLELNMTREMLTRFIFNRSGLPEKVRQCLAG